ncbi:MAG: AGE family epimerase/isomerase [Blastocatellales bacterium]
MKPFFLLLSTFYFLLSTTHIQTGKYDRYLTGLERNLRENIMPFWLDKTIDRKNGGYHLNFDREGMDKGPGVRMIVTQARQVWLFSRLTRAGYCKCLGQAEHGYRFLLDRMWDARNGGFYWEVDETGLKVTKDRKHLYGQSFALYAISEYALASGRDDVRKFAVRFFELLESKAHDKVHGGYREFFTPDWREETREMPYLGGAAGVKLMNTHLHLLEAMTTFYRLTKLPVARERLIELITIESNTVVRKEIGACTDKYSQDWKPLLDGDFARVSYGHDLENIWLLADACDAAGLPQAPLLDLYRTLFAYSLKYGYDAAQGGFYDSGSFNQPADRRTKVWWVQSEALVGALYMYKLTGDTTYLDVFSKTFDFVQSRQTDWQNGEWFANVSPDGVTSGDKAQPWKSGYHNGRAMIESIALLRTLK